MLPLSAPGVFTGFVNTKTAASKRRFSWTSLKLAPRRVTLSQRPSQAAADRSQPPSTKEQIRDAVREACASRSHDEVNQLRDLCRERWLKGAKKGEPQDLDKEIDAKLGNNLRFRKECRAFLHHTRG